MTTTTYKDAYLPTVSGDAGTWGNKLNSSLDNSTFKVFDANLGGLVSKTLTSSNVTLTAVESQNAVVRLTGTLSASVQITTECQGFHIVENLCTLGAYAVTMKNDTAAGTATIPYGRWLVIFDDTNGARLITPEAASATASGIIELATDAEVQTGTDTARAVTPAGLATVLPAAASTTVAGKVELATDAEAITGTDTSRAVTAANITARAAAQSDMEAATSSILHVTPSQQHNHPGHPKAGGNFNGSGTPAFASGDYGMGAITDNGTGNYTLAFDTAFANANYWIAGFARGSTVAVTVSADSGDTKTTSSIQVRTMQHGASHTDYDSSEVGVAFWGDYA